MQPNYVDFKPQDVPVNDVQPLAPYQSPPMTQVNQQQFIEPNNNLGGNVQVEYQSAFGGTTEPAQEMLNNGLTKFSSPFNFTALIMHFVGFGLMVPPIVMLPLCIIPVIGLVVSFVTLVLCSVSLLIHSLATLIFSKSEVVFDDNNRVITASTKGAIIPLPKSSGTAGYDEVNDFVVRVVPGVAVNNQPVATVSMILKNGGNITVQGASPVYQSRIFATRLKNFLQLRVRT